VAEAGQYRARGGDLRGRLHSDRLRRRRPRGRRIRHLEWPIHAEILAARPEVNVVAPHSSLSRHGAVGDQRRDRPVLERGRLVHRRRPDFSSRAISSTRRSSARSWRGRSEAHAVLLKNHGATFVGTSVRRRPSPVCSWSEPPACTGAGRLRPRPRASGHEEIAEKRRTSTPRGQSRTSAVLQPQNSTERKAHPHEDRRDHRHRNDGPGNGRHPGEGGMNVRCFDTSERLVSASPAMSRPPPVCSSESADRRRRRPDRSPSTATCRGGSRRRPRHRSRPRETPS